MKMTKVAQAPQPEYAQDERDKSCPDSASEISRYLNFLPRRVNKPQVLEFNQSNTVKGSTDERKVFFPVRPSQGNLML